MEVDTAPPPGRLLADKGHNVVERCFIALKHKRGVVTCYDTLADRFEVTIQVANIDRWLKRLS